MKVHLSLFLLICMGEILIIRSQNESATDKGPGISSCLYFGSVDKSCGLTPVNVADLPSCCSSFFFDGLTVDVSFDVFQTFGDTDNEYLDEICGTGKNVYVCYGHKTYAEWSLILACMDCDSSNAVEETEGLNAFLKDHPGITGLVLRNLEPTPCSKEVVGLTDSLIKYIEVVRDGTSLEIGLYIYASSFLDYYADPQYPWLDFPKLDCSVDFYVFTLICFNVNCTQTLRATGMSPMDGDTDYTLSKLASAIQEAQIPKEKIFYNFELKPSSPDSSDRCVVNNQMMCKFPGDSKGWCSDTMQTYYDKGKWAVENGAGFVGNNIDFDDPQGCCSCSPYPAFNAIVAGARSGPPAQACPLIDRTA